jgi:hypothetical protein
MTAIRANRKSGFNGGQPTQSKPFEDSTRSSSISRRKFLLAAGAGAAAVTVSGSVIGFGSFSTNTGPECHEGAVIEPPTQGEWLVLNPPGHSELAQDFIGMKQGHRLPYAVSSVPRHLLYKLPVSRAFGWGRPVFSPIEGEVVEVSNDEPDREHVNLFSDAVSTLVSPPTIEDGDIRPAAGNYVLIDSPKGVVFLAHLKQDSVNITQGMHVTPGQFLGEVGNSGASVFPHLHVQLMREWTTDLTRLESVLLPYRFSNYDRKVGNWFTGYSWEAIQDCSPKQRERFRVIPNTQRTSVARLHQSGEQLSASRMTDLS